MVQWTMIVTRSSDRTLTTHIAAICYRSMSCRTENYSTPNYQVDNLSGATSNFLWSSLTPSLVHEKPCIVHNPALFLERTYKCSYRFKRPHPAPRYCVRTKGKRANLDQPGSCGKGQVYLEGAVDILRAVDDIDFHLLYSGRVRVSSRLFRVEKAGNHELVPISV